MPKMPEFPDHNDRHQLEREAFEYEKYKDQRDFEADQWRHAGEGVGVVLVIGIFAFFKFFLEIAAVIFALALVFFLMQLQSAKRRAQYIQSVLDRAAIMVGCVVLVGVITNVIGRPFLSFNGVLGLMLFSFAAAVVLVALRDDEQREAQEQKDASPTEQNRTAEPKQPEGFDAFDFGSKDYPGFSPSSEDYNAPPKEAKTSGAGTIDFGRKKTPGTEAGEASKTGHDLPGASLVRMAQDFNRALKSNADKLHSEKAYEAFLQRFMQKRPDHFREILRIASDQPNANEITRNIVSKLNRMLHGSRANSQSERAV